MTRDEIINEYFEWMYNLVSDKKYSKRVSFKKLLMYLHTIEFRYSISNDANRAQDGVDLRWRFACKYGYDDIFEEISEYLDGPCSVLEMLIALAVRCEEHIMDDPDIGNRTGQWFWIMITNLGLSSCTNDNFEKNYVDERLVIFLDRQYRSNGEGGLFVVRNCRYDLRSIEIWYQMCWYLESIL